MREFLGRAGILETLLFVAVAVLACILFSTSSISANSYIETPPKGQAYFYPHIINKYIITNSKGEYLHMDGPELFDYDSTMWHRIRQNEVMDESDEDQTLIVKDSKAFTITISDEGPSTKEAHVWIYSGLHKSVAFGTFYADKLIIDGNDIGVVSTEGTTCIYSLSTYMPKVKQYYGVSGFVIGKVMLKEEGKKVKLVGAQGNTSIRIYDENLDFPIAMGRYYFLGGTSYISEKNWKLVATNAVPLSDHKTKDPTMLYVRPIKRGKNLLLTWNRIKGAQSYIVYKYDYKAKKYKRYDTLDGNGRNYCNIPGVDDSSTYKFVIRAKSKLDGKGKFVGKRSYAVWSVGKNNPAKGNATSVVINKKALKGKKGKTASLKAKVYTSEGKEILSDSVRWYSTNKKVATAGTFTGKIKFRKKGTAYIYAKAHNGKNSKKIKVTVK